MSVTTNQLMDLGWPASAAKLHAELVDADEGHRLANLHTDWVGAKGVEKERRRGFLWNLESLCLRYGYTIVSRYEGGVELSTSIGKADVADLLKDLGK